MEDVGYFDGACEPHNPGGAMGWGWTLKFADGYHRASFGGEPPAEQNTNNVAEYRAALALLESYVADGFQGPLRVYGDSMLVVQQVSRRWACRQPQLQALREQVWELVARIPGGVTFTHVPREQNAEADALSMESLRALGIVRRERHR